MLKNKFVNNKLICSFITTKNSSLHIIENILQLAQSEPGGFTVRLPELGMVTHGIVCTYIETQDCFGRPGLEKAVKHSTEHENILGGWYNSENDRFYFDSCKLFEVEAEAIRFGRENNQIAIFDLTNIRVIEL